MENSEINSARLNPESWLKLNYRSRTKLIHDPPRDLHLLIQRIRRHFRDLDQKLRYNESKINGKVQLIQMMNLAYIDSEGEENDLENAKDLDLAYTYASKRASQRVLKIIIKTKNDLEIAAELSKQTNAYQSMKMNEQHKGNIEEKEQELQMAQAMTNVQLAEEKAMADLIENPYLGFEKLNNPYPINPDAQKIKHHSNNLFKKKLQLQVGIVCRKIHVPGRSVKVSEKGKSVISRWINHLMNTEKLPESRFEQGVIVGDQKECYVLGKPGSPISLRFEIKNQSKKSWSKDTYLKNYSTDEASLPTIKLTERLHPGEMLQMNIMIFLPRELFDKEKIILQFRLENAQREQFGESLIAIIDLKPSAFIEESEHLIEAVSEDLVLRQSIMDIENEGLYDKASKLCDKGYGEFDRCITILKACKGNLKEAELILSKLMIKEHRS